MISDDSSANLIFFYEYQLGDQTETRFTVTNEKLSS